MKFHALCILTTLLAVDHAASFVPVTTRPIQRSLMLQEKKNDWSDRILSDWFHLPKASSSTTVKKKEKKKTDDWVARETIKVGEADEEVDVGVKGWEARDMRKAGHAEGETKDWVAEDMTKAGHLGSPQDPDWVAEDMKSTGEKSGIGHALKSKFKRKTKTDRIAEDMKLAGSAVDKDVITHDMEAAGKGEAESPTHRWVDNLNKALTKQHEKEYDDVYDDMKKAGRQGSESDKLIAQDLEHAGKAEYYTEKLDEATHYNASYKFEVEKSAYDVDWIKKDMAKAGHSGSQDWIARDLEAAGHATPMGGSAAPDRDKDLADYLAQGERATIGRDLAKKGKGVAFVSREKLTYGNKLEDLVAEDMKKAGAVSKDTDWVARDMERAGHTASSQWNKDTGHVSPKEWETEEFMKTRKPGGKPTRWEPAAVEAEAEATEPEADLVTEEHHENILLHIAKKVVMPWKKWKDL